MRFRTKLFIAWVGLTLVLGGGAYWAIRRSVKESFDQLDRQTFAGINRGLRHLYLERIAGLQQACELVVNIPDLRALIAEQNLELVRDNQESLCERLNYLNDVVGATFI